MTEIPAYLPLDEVIDATCSDPDLALKMLLQVKGVVVRAGSRKGERVVAMDELAKHYPHVYARIEARYFVKHDSRF